MKQFTTHTLLASLFFALAGAGLLFAPEAQAARPTVAGNAAAIADNEVAITENRDAICALVDKTNLTPRPAFCPDPPTCPCWVGSTPSDLLAVLEAVGPILTTPYCLLVPGIQAAAGDDLDGIPGIQAAIAGSVGVCSVAGLPTVPDMPPTQLTLEEAVYCVGQLEAIIPSLSWCP